MVKCTERLIGEFIALRGEGYSYREIAKKKKVSKSTVAYHLDKTDVGVPVCPNTTVGRRRSLSVSEMRVLKRIHTDSPKDSAVQMGNKLREKTGKIISDSTVERSLRRLNLFAFKSCYKPLLSKKNIKKRLDIAKQWIGKPETYWDNVIFSDECKFNLFTSDGISYVWREPGQRLNPRYVSPTVKHGGGSVMVWGCFSKNGMGKLTIIEGNMNSQMYTTILSENLKSSATDMGLDTVIFQQDNDPKHQSAHTRAYFIENNIDLLIIVNI